MKKLLCSAMLGILIVLAICSLCACVPESGDSNTIVVGTTASIEKAIRDEYNFDMLASGVSEMPLVAKSTTGEYSALVATYQSEDSKVWTYTIVDGLTWSDGVSVTADDIVYSLQYEEKMGGEGSFTEDYTISNDGKSVTLTLQSANVKALDEMTTFRIRPKHVYEGKTEVTEEEARITCGPYKLDSFNKEAGTITFVENEYYPTKPNIEKVVYKLFGNQELMYAALINGELDFVWNYSNGVSSTYQTLLGNVSNITLESVTATNCPAVLVFNNKTGLFSDKNLRFAVSYALDYQQFKEYFGSAYAETPNRSFAPSSLVGYTATEKLETSEEKAAQYMTAAGYTKGETWWEKDGQIAEFTLTVNASKDAHVSYSEFVKTQLENFGIKVNLDTVNAATYNTKTSNKFATENGNGTITMEAAIMGYTAYGMKNFGDMYIDGTHTVQGGAQVFSDELTEIRNRLNNAATLEQYQQAAADLQNFYAQETPAIALYWDSMIYARSSKLNNIVMDATFGMNNIKTWFSITKE